MITWASASYDSKSLCADSANSREREDGDGINGRALPQGRGGIGGGGGEIREEADSFSAVA